MKKIFELPIAEIFDLTSDEIMGSISGDIVEFPEVEEDEEASDNF